jgi:hypothetical protein
LSGSRTTSIVLDPREQPLRLLARGAAREADLDVELGLAADVRHTGMKRAGLGAQRTWAFAAHERAGEGGNDESGQLRMNAERHRSLLLVWLNDGLLYEQPSDQPAEAVFLGLSLARPAARRRTAQES